MRVRSRTSPNGSSTTVGIGKRASIGWKAIWANCRPRRTRMDAGTSVAVDAADRELVVTRILDAPRRLVFQAWTEPDRAARWGGAQGFTTIYCDMEVRPGGTFRASMRSPEGAVHCRRGVYSEVVEPERLVLTLFLGGAEGEPGQQKG